MTNRHIVAYVVIFTMFSMYFIGSTIRLNNIHQDRLRYIHKKNIILKDRVENLSAKLNKYAKSTSFDSFKSFIQYINPQCGDELAILIAKTILKKSKKHNINPIIILAMIKVESSFNPFLISKAGARGLMQVMPNKNKLKFDSIKLHNIDYGIEAGILVLKEKLQQNDNNMILAIERYNGIGQSAKEFKTKVLTTIGFYNCLKE